MSHGSILSQFNRINTVASYGSGSSLKNILINMSETSMDFNQKVVCNP